MVDMTTTPPDELGFEQLCERSVAGDIFLEQQGSKLRVWAGHPGIRDVQSQVIENWIGLVQLLDDAGRVVLAAWVVAPGTDFPAIETWVERGIWEVRHARRLAA